MIWFSETQGPLGFPGAFSGDRPFLSLIYVATTALLPNNPLAWQILALITRVLLGLSVWWMFRKVWPGKYLQACWIAILVVVFPGFKQQPISVVYGNGMFLLISYFASYAFMIMAMRIEDQKKRIVFFIASIATYAFCLLSTEYYIGLDLLRGAVIWIIIKREHLPNKRHFQQIFLTWLPYLILLGLFLFWRVFIFGFPTYQPELLDAFDSNAGSGLLTLIYRFIRDPIVAGWQSWSSIFYLPKLTELYNAADRVYWLLVLVGGIAAWFVLRVLSRWLPSTDTQRESEYHKETFLLAGIGLFAAGFPFWVTGLPLELFYPFDRFLLAYIFGSCLLVISLLEWIVRNNLQKTIILTLIIAASIGANFQNANTYRREWLTHQQFFHQLAWRAPALEKNTILLTNGMPFRYYSDNSLTAPLNLLYDPYNTTLQLSYYLAYTDVRVGRSIPSLETGIPIQQGFRNANFSGNTSNTLVFFFSPPGCLRLLDKERDQNLPILPDDYHDIIHLSNLDRINPTPQTPPAHPAKWFGKEPIASWCYYFEHADLEAQLGNWDQSVSWFENGLESGFSPAEPSEWIVYFEGLFETGAGQDVFGRSVAYFFENPIMHQPICDMLSRINGHHAELAVEPQMTQLIETMDCFH